MNTEENVGTETPVEPQVETESAPVESTPEEAPAESEVVTITEETELEPSNTQSNEYKTQDGSVVKDEYMIQ